MEDIKNVEKPKRTDWEKKQARKKYMREYYLRRKGFKKTIKSKKKIPENTFSIRQGNFLVCFD